MKLKQNYNPINQIKRISVIWDT